MIDIIPIKTALISVSDKEKIVELAQALISYNCKIISTGGTRKILEESSISTIEVNKVSGNPEAFGGRMKTISFNIESALLFDREKDKTEADSLGIEPIDLVVCNLYPFQKVWANGAGFEQQIENIDIGGPTMIRAAAKNFKYVAVITDPLDYVNLITELTENNGGLSYKTRKKLMTKAFNLTADYDSFISTTMDKEIGKHSLRLAFEKGIPLRYGENSHQSTHFYRTKKAKTSLYDIEILNGKALSYNNILDINGAIESVLESNKNIQACAIIKHNNPCGYCEGKDQTEVLTHAWAGDSISAFGSIIIFNQKLKLETAHFFQLDNKDKSKRKFIEIIIAPSFSEEALNYLQKNKNLRVLKFDSSSLSENTEYRFLNGSLLVQDKDNQLFSKIEIVTTPKKEVNEGLINFGLRLIKNIKSNSIAIVREKNGYQQLLGMGAGQPNRLIATQLAIEKSKINLKNEFKGNTINFEAYFQAEMSKVYLISDAFFPFTDNVELASEFGIKTIVQPGGSIRDREVIKTCDDKEMTMVFTGMRHFKH